MVGIGPFAFVYGIFNKKSSDQVTDGYGNFLAYPTTGTPLTREQFDHFQKVSRIVSENYHYIESIYGQKRSYVSPPSRLQLIQWGLNITRCPVQPFFVPRTLYDILTTHAIADPEIWSSRFQQELKIYVPKNEICPDFMSRANEKAKNTFDSIANDLAFATNECALEQLGIHKKGPDLSMDDMIAFTSSCFFNSPWYAAKWEKFFQYGESAADVNPQTRAQNRASRCKTQFAKHLSNAIRLECSVRDSTVLYRGCCKKTDSLWGNWGHYGTAPEYIENGKKIPWAVHSLSYGTSLVSGCQTEQSSRGASPLMHCLENMDCLAIVVPNKDKDDGVFYIPSPSLQMLSGGEYFHPRTRLPARSYHKFQKISEGEAKEITRPDSIRVTGFWKEESMPRTVTPLFFDGTFSELENIWKSYQESAIVL